MFLSRKCIIVIKAVVFVINIKSISFFKSLIFFSIFFTFTGQSTFEPIILNDITRLSPTPVEYIIQPKSIEEIQQILLDASQQCKKVSICGTRFSQGGHISFPHGIALDMRKLNKIKKIDVEHKEITVQAGATWYEIQERIDRLGLSIKAMQSYNDFSIGGSLSVNVHGQDIVSPTLIQTVKEIVIVLPDGSVKHCNRVENSELFFSAIGGYGLVGVIVEVTLYLTDNVVLEKKSKNLKTKDYPAYFLSEILHNPKVQLHSARLSMNPFSFCESLLAVTYQENNEREHDACLKKYNRKVLDRIIFFLLKSTYTAKIVRNTLEKHFFENDELVTRNNAMAHSVEGLCTYNFRDVNILQEYFIPIEHFEAFIEALKTILPAFSTNTLNISIRFVKKNNESYLSYASQDSFAFVIFINHKRTQGAIEKVKSMTIKLINAALALNGTYYLPYQLYATHEQIKKAYPRFQEFISLKNKVDPNELLSNNFFNYYKNVNF